ncbi:MAG: LysR family transcriptional regulator [Pseudomonadota bacterium]
MNSFLAVADWQSLSSAAQHLGVTKSAVSSNIRKLEDMLSATLFERLPSASIPTRFSRQLIRYIKLARSYMRHAVDEVLSMQGEETGQISIGSLPFVRTLIIPRAIARLRQAHPNFDVSTLEGPYDDLVSALRCGDIDLLVGALRGPNLEPGLEEDPIMTDELSVIVRVGHPLQNVEPLTWSMLLDYEWILPRVGTPTRSLFETALRKQKMQCPEHVVETSSMVLLRGLLLEGDQLTVLSRHQIIREEESSMLAVLPFKLHNTYRPIGITSRSGSNMAPAAKLLVEQIRAVVMDLT